MKLTFALLLSLLLLSCGPQVAGFGSETTNGSTGIVTVSMTGEQNFSSAEVKAVPADYNPAEANGTAVISGKSDSAGTAKLRIPDGKWSIYAVHPVSGKKMFIQNVVISGDTVITGTLESTGSLKVTFIDSDAMLDTVNGYISIDGLPEYLPLAGNMIRQGDSVTALFPELPSAKISVRYGVKGGETQLLSDTAVIAPAKTEKITVQLYYRYMTAFDSPLLSDTVSAVTLGAEPGLVWIGTSQGITRYKDNAFISRTSEDSPLKNNRITSVTESSDSVTWFGTENGLSRLTEGNWTTHTTAVSPFLPSNRITALASGRKGTLWVGTDSGIVYMKSNSTTKITVQNGLPSNRITALALDSSGRVWGGTDAGAFSIDSSMKITRYTQETLGTFVMPSSVITAVEASPEGTVWICTAGGGFVTIKGEKIGCRYFSGSHSILNWITALRFDSEGNSWFGTKSGAIIRYDGTKWFCHLSSEGTILPGAEILSFAVDTKHNLYCGTKGKGLFLLGPNAETLFTAE